MPFFLGVYPGLNEEMLSYIADVVKEFIAGVGAVRRAA